MPRKKTKEQIKQNMSRVRNRDTQLENALCDALKQQGIRTFTRNDKTVYGKPDVVSSVQTLYMPVFASMEKLTIGVVRYLTQTALLAMMIIGSPTITEGMKQPNPLRSSILILFAMSSLRLFITAFRILMFRKNHLAFR